jgi:hypothetical protein
MMKQIRLLLPALALATAGALVQPVSIAAQVTSWDAANDFSLTSNPNGAWSYGWSTSRGSAFSFMTATENFENSGFYIWEESASQELPFVGHNGMAADANFATVTVPAGTMAMHPGGFGENAIVRWTAPAAGIYSVAATFTGRDYVGPTSTDVAVLRNGAELWSDEVDGYLVSRSYSSNSVVMAGGDTLDFTVGFGADGNYLFDSTGFAAQIALVGPAPGYSVCPLYDQTKAVQGGSTVPIKLELCDAAGVDVSSQSIVVTALGLTQVSTSASGSIASSGNANPDDNFRYDSTLGTSGGYIFNLSTKGLSTGTYRLSFTAEGDPSVHSVMFEVR